MHKLANFSVETDRVVLLQFRDGQERRVPVGQLPQYLGTNDLARVSAALRLRREFLKDHMPRLGGWALLAGGALAAVLVAGNPKSLAQLVQPAGSAAPASTPAEDHASPSLPPGSQPGLGSSITLHEELAARPASQSVTSKGRAGVTSAAIKLVSAATQPLGRPASTLLDVVLPALASNPAPLPVVRITPWPEPTATPASTQTAHVIPTTTPDATPDPSPTPLTPSVDPPTPDPDPPR